MDLDCQMVFSNIARKGLAVMCATYRLMKIVMPSITNGRFAFRKCLSNSKKTPDGAYMTAEASLKDNYDIALIIVLSNG